MQILKQCKRVLVLCSAVVCTSMMASVATRANVLCSGIHSWDWTNNGTLPWGSHTDHGSQYYQSWDASVDDNYGVITLHSIYNPGDGYRYDSGVVYGNTEVPSSGYDYVTVDMDIYAPTAGVRGCWPAFWLDSATSWPPEVDIAEFKGDNCNGGNVLQNVDDSNGNWICSQASSISASNWHHYGLAMGPGNGGWRSYQLYIDGSLKAQGNFWDSKSAPFWVICNYAMEGDSNSYGPSYNTYAQFSNYKLETHSNSSSGISNGNHAVVPQCDTNARLDANGWSGNNGTKVQIWNGSTQTWAFTNKGNNIYQIAEAWNTGACLDVTNFGGSGTPTEIWSCWGGTPQQWRAISDGGNIYEFEPQCATGTRLDVYYGSSNNGTKVQIWSTNGASAQKWAVN